MLFVDILEAYRLYLTSLGGKSRTTEDYILDFNLFVKWLNETYDAKACLDDIELGDIEKFLLTLKEKGEKLGVNGESVTLTETKSILKEMRETSIQERDHIYDEEYNERIQLDINRLIEGIRMQAYYTEMNTQKLILERFKNVFHIDSNQDLNESLKTGIMDAASLAIAGNSFVQSDGITVNLNSTSNIEEEKEVAKISQQSYKSNIDQNNLLKTRLKSLSNVELLKMIGYNEKIMDYPILDVEKNSQGYDTIFYTNEAGEKEYIHSKYNMEKEWGFVKKDLEIGKKDALYIVYGLGLGHHIKTLKKKISNRSFIYVIEKNLNIVSTYMHTQKFSDIVDNNILFFFGEDEEIIKRIDGKLFTFDIMPLFGNITNIILPSYRKIYGDWIIKIQKRIIDVICHKYFILGNDMGDTITGIKNNFENIDELIKSPSIELMKDTYKNKPLIIVAAGPSLDKNIHELKQAQGKAIIIATDAVLSTLKKHEIVPDGVVSIERILMTYEKFYNGKEINPKIVFIGPPVVRREIFETMKKNKKLICLKEGEMINEWINTDILKENRLLHMGTSCAHIAFSFGKCIGANPIVFVGQDLAYTKEGITHSKDVEIVNKIDTKNSQGLFDVKGINGEILPTSSVFKHFLTWYELEISKDGKERGYIDATEGGAYIRGTTVMKLKDVIDNYCNQNIISLYEKVPEGVGVKQKYERCINEVEKTYKMFNEIKREANRQMLRLNGVENKIIEKVSEKDMENIKRVINQGQIVEKLVIGNDIARTLFQAPLMMGITQIRMYGNGNTIDMITHNIIIQKKIIASIIAGCYSVLDILYIIENVLKSNLDN